MLHFHAYQVFRGVFQMKITNRNDGAQRSFASRAKSLAGIGLGASLLLAGVAFFGVAPASAATSTVVFSTQPPTTAFLNQPLSFSVNITAGGAASDIIVISSPDCTLVNNSALTSTWNGTSPTAFSGVLISAGTTCHLVASDTTASDTGTSGNSTAIAMTAFSTATKLGFNLVPPTTATAGVALTAFKVATEDTYGNVVTSSPNDNITISTSGTGCALGSGVNTVAESASTPGIATFSDVILATDGSCTLTALDATNGSITSTPASAAITVSGGAPAKLAFSVVPPASVLTTGTIVTTFKVAVEDTGGNVDTATTGSTDVISISSPCLAAPVAATAVAGVATFSTVEFATTGACVLTATDTLRTVTGATATSVVGQAQAVLTVTTTSGYLDVPITLAASGGSGTGAVTFTVTDGTATGCTITSGMLKASKGGTCLVTATRAAVAPYAPATSVATTVTISSAPKAVRVVGPVTKGKKSTITVTGYNFSGRPKVTSNVAGFKALVTRDSGKTLTVTITVTGSTRPGVKVLALAFANGMHASVKYSLRA
ncbi:MAG: hypothetical protein JWM55_1234 [Acidimicrobiaceae bacterium]|nr:hypothetical protein [Acidimicrobiaceae bacterium]